MEKSNVQRKIVNWQKGLNHNVRPRTTSYIQRNIMRSNQDRQVERSVILVNKKQRALATRATRVRSSADPVPVIPEEDPEAEDPGQRRTLASRRAPALDRPSGHDEVGGH